MITSSPPPSPLSSSTASLHYECPNHYTVPQFCVCHSSLVDDDENKIRCNQCYEWYHPRCLHAQQSLDGGEFCCGHCQELPDLANMKSINLAKKERAEAIQRGNSFLLALREFEVNICPVIDKIELLEPYLCDFPTLQDALTNDATLAHRVYSSSQYRDALKASHEINDLNFYELAPLLSKWEERLLKYQNQSIPDTLLMEWCCSIDLIIQDLTLNINQTSLQNPTVFTLIQNLMKYLQVYMNRSLQPREDVDRINSIILEDQKPTLASRSSSPSESEPSNIFSHSSQWVGMISQLFSLTDKPSNSDEQYTLPPVTPTSMEFLIKQGRNLLQVYDSIAIWDLNDSFSWLQDINHLLSKLLDILESKWVEINNLYSKINKLFPFILSPSSNKEKKLQNKINEEELHELIIESEEMYLRSEILQSLREVENRFTSLQNKITENLKDLSTHHLPILEELESEIATFPVRLSESLVRVQSSIQILRGLSEFPDFNSQNTLCQVRLTSENYQSFLQDLRETSHSTVKSEKHASPQTKSGPGRKRSSSKDLTSSPPSPPQEKIRYDTVMSFLELTYHSDSFHQDIQIYYHNLQFLSTHLRQLLEQEPLQRIFQHNPLATEESSNGFGKSENILKFLQSQQEVIKDFSQQLSLEYYQNMEIEYELKYLLSSIEILKHYLARQQPQQQQQQEKIVGFPPLPLQETCQTIAELNQEMNCIHEIINYSESSTSLLLQTFIRKLFEEDVIPMISKCISSYEQLNDYLEQMLYTDECSVTLQELKSLFLSVYFELNLKDPPLPPDEQQQPHPKKKSGRNHHHSHQTSTAPRTFDSLKRIIGITEQLESFLDSLPTIDIQLLHEHVQQTKEEFLTVFPSVDFNDFENILTIIYRLPLSQDFKESITR
jgi:hypothetical protein